MNCLADSKAARQLDPNTGHEGGQSARPFRANNCLTHRSKDSLPFRRRATVKSVTDLPIGA
jgi:hypothetical protein